MVNLTITPRIRSAIDTYNSIAGHDRIDPSCSSVPHRTLHLISRTTNVSFASLLVGSSVYIPPPPPPPQKSPEYLALMKRLSAEAEAREYAAIVAPTADDEEQSWAEVKSQLTAVGNVLLSVFATAAAVWKVAESWETPERLAVSMSAALLVAVAEVVLFWGFLRRVEESRGKAKVKTKLMEGEDTREIVRSWEIGPSDKKG